MHRRLRRTSAALVLLGLALLPAGAQAEVGTASPPAGTISPASPSTSWEGADRTASTPGETDQECNAQDTLPGGVDAYCEDFRLTVQVDETYWQTHQGGVTVDLTGNTPAEDFDLYVYDVNGTEVATSGLPAGVESAVIPCPTRGASPYQVRVVYFNAVDDGVAGTPGYDASATLSTSAGTEDCGAATPDGGPATFVEGDVAFGPATIGSAHWLGSEPQITIERKLAQALPGSGLDPKRWYIDWPLSSRTQIGQLSRSTDGGDSFRLLFDRACAERSRPNCASGGGGDTEEDVNLVSGLLLFSDQELLINEAITASTDHGDSFVVQDAVSTPTSATDRQWVAATDSSTSVGGIRLDAFLTFHTPPNQYIVGIDPNGLPIPQVVPQLHDVGQSGQPRVDNNPSSPGHGWIYQPYISFNAGGTWVATARSADYPLETGWQVNQATGNSTTSFPWVSIDKAGNAYLVWDTGGKIYYAASKIDDPANDPRVGGRPGTKWTPRIKVSAPLVGSAVFGEVIAGDKGRIAVAYDGTTEHIGEPDDAEELDHWDTYVAVIPDALAATPTVHTGKVSHRSIHMGNVCSGGLGCTTNPAADRSLLDMIDLSYTQDGRVGVVFTDNNTMSFHQNPGAEDQSPFTHTALQVAGPSIVASKSPISVPVVRDARTDPAGDATWPNTAAGVNLPSLDVRDATLRLEGTDLVARIGLADASVARRVQDLATYNADPGCLNALSCDAARIQHVMRFSSPNEIYHLSLETLASGATRAFGGRLDENDYVFNVDANGIIGAAYGTDAGYPVTSSVEGSTLVLRAPASAFGFGPGVELTSVTAFAIAGPLEADGGLATRPHRTVDASPPFDTTLSSQLAGADLAVQKSDSPDPVGVGQTLTYTVVVTNVGTVPATRSELKDALPRSVAFLDAQSTKGTCALSRRSVGCSLGSMAPGQSATITIHVEPQQAGVVSNTATASSRTPDVNAANNSDTEQTTVTS